MPSSPMLVLYSAHSNDSAYLRSQATQLAYEILDNMRANPTAAAAGNYNTTLTTAAVNPGYSCLNAACPVAANLAAYDLYAWKTRLAAPTVCAALRGRLGHRLHDPADHGDHRRAMGRLGGAIRYPAAPP